MVGVWRARRVARVHVDALPLLELLPLPHLLQEHLADAAGDLVQLSLLPLGKAGSGGQGRSDARRHRNERSHYMGGLDNITDSEKNC